MWIRVEGGGSDNVDKDFLHVLQLCKTSFGLFNAYLIVFDLILPKKAEKKPIVKRKKNIYIIKFEMWIRSGGGWGVS